MSFENIFQSFQEKAASNPPLGSTLKFDFGDGQFIYLDGSGESNVVSAEDKDAACVVIVSLDNLQKVMSGDLNPMMAFMSGKIKVKGDMGVVMKLQSLLQ